MGEVYTIPYQGIACVVSDSPKSSFDYGTKEEVAKKLVGYPTVIEKVMKEHTIISIKFVTLLKDKDEVKKVLQRGYSQFQDRLKNMDKKIELNVVAVWDDLNSVIKKIGKRMRKSRILRRK